MCVFSPPIVISESMPDASFTLLVSKPGKEVLADTVGSCFGRRGDGCLLSLLYPRCNSGILLN